MKNKAISIQIIPIKNVMITFCDISYPSMQYQVEEYSENLYDRVSVNL
ncbi:hypothetical protein H9M94_00925 [Mycoplasma sp. Pen4]|nr:hypothetical protein [Mycoplasma sp. Pen4]QNM93823.1 hypothetical protein H9M94_00925 [Mycoplasma sp. Pen4]